MEDGSEAVGPPPLAKRDQATLPNTGDPTLVGVALMMEKAQPLMETLSNGLVKTAEVNKEAFVIQVKSNEQQHRIEVESDVKVALDAQDKGFKKDLAQIGVIALVLLGGVIAYFMDKPNAFMLVTHSLAAALGFFAGGKASASKIQKESD